jgi:hypothetical protein
MKLFISYRRQSWPLAQQLADQLKARLDADVFIDYRSIDNTDFEIAILKHLRESDAVLLIVVEGQTFDPARIHNFLPPIFQKIFWEYAGCKASHFTPNILNPLFNH